MPRPELPTAQDGVGAVGARADRSSPRLVLDVALAAGLAWVLVGGWMATASIGRTMPTMHRGPAELDVPAAVVLIALAAGVTVVVRRWHPRAAWLAGLVSVAGYLALDGAAAAAVAVCAVLGASVVKAVGARRGWPWLLAVLPAYAAAEPFSLAQWLQVATMVVWTLLLIAGAVALGRRRESAALARQQELARIAQQERMRVARDIHDVVGHSLALISLQSGVALKVLESDPAQARASLEAVRDTSRQALTEVRRTLGVFRDEAAPLAPSPDLASIATLVEQVRTSGSQVDLAPLPDAAGIPLSVLAVAHRVVQEAVTNALRHAPGAAIRVAVTRSTDTLGVTVADTGRPPSTLVEGAGLTGMRERVGALGGQVVITPSPGGLVVEALLPLTTADLQPGGRS